jgi:hypothetical protein
MKPLFLSMLLIAVLAVPLAAQPGMPGNSDHVSVSAERGDHATIELSPESRSGFELSGALRDAADQPIDGAQITIVRFEVTGAANADDDAKDLVPLRDLNSQVPPFVIKQTYPVVTADDGSFTLDRRLPPGRYSLQVDWDEVPDTSSFVRWDVRWVIRGQETVAKR